MYVETQRDSIGRVIERCHVTGFNCVGSSAAVELRFLVGLARNCLPLLIRGCFLFDGRVERQNPVSAPSLAQLVFSINLSTE